MEYYLTHKIKNGRKYNTKKVNNPYGKRKFV